MHLNLFIVQVPCQQLQKDNQDPLSVLSSVKYIEFGWQFGKLVAEMHIELSSPKNKAELPKLWISNPF